jgi:hypothetical protein
MDQQGNVPGSGIQTIDQLRYNYEDNEQSNRLLKVGDAMPDYGTGDFVNTNGTANDYSYDANGNLASDANKEIDTIIYTHFDKPQNWYGNRVWPIRLPIISVAMCMKTTAFNISRLPKGVV